MRSVTGTKPVEVQFPKPVRLGARFVAWIEHEIDEWLMRRSK